MTLNQIPPVKDLSGYMQLAKSWRTVFSPFGASVKALWDGPSQNEVTVMWHVRGKFVKDFGIIKPNQKWIEITGFTQWKFDSEGRSPLNCIRFKCNFLQEELFPIIATGMEITC